MADLFVVTWMHAAYPVEFCSYISMLCKYNYLVESQQVSFRYLKHSTGLAGTFPILKKHCKVQDRLIRRRGQVRCKMADAPTELKATGLIEELFCLANMVAQLFQPSALLRSAFCLALRKVPPN